ncbi:MAG: hypothetical protein Q9208_002179 [Pyrenodesmia sp. 3 TL-2023]
MSTHLGSDFTDKILKQALQKLQAASSQTNTSPDVVRGALEASLRECCQQELELDVQELPADIQESLMGIVVQLQQSLSPSTVMPHAQSGQSVRAPTPPIKIETQADTTTTEGTGPNHDPPSPHPAANGSMLSAGIRSAVSYQPIASDVFTYLLWEPCKYVFSGISTIPSRMAATLLKVMITSSIIIPAICFSIALAAWRYKGTVAVVLLQIAMGIFNNVILDPLCQSTSNFQSTVCESICTVAHTRGIQPRACLEHHNWKAAGQSQPPTLTRQLRFAELGVEDLRDRFQGLDVPFDKVTGSLTQAHGHFAGLGTSVARYSREATLLFEWFSISGAQLELDILESASPSAASWSSENTLLNLLSMLWRIGAIGSPAESPLDTYVNTIRPKLHALLILGYYLREDFTTLGVQETELTGQFASTQRTLWGMYVEGTKQCSGRGTATGRCQSSHLDAINHTRASIEALAIGYTKVTDASTSTFRSFRESLMQLESLNTTLGYHATWVGPLAQKPLKVYHAQIEASVQQARQGLETWEQEDRRHEQYLFKSPAERVHSMYQPYADEFIR